MTKYRIYYTNGNAEDEEVIEIEAYSYHNAVSKFNKTNPYANILSIWVQCEED